MHWRFWCSWRYLASLDTSLSSGVVFFVGGSCGFKAAPCRQMDRLC